MSFSFLQHPMCRVSSLLKGSSFLQPRILARFWLEKYQTYTLENSCSFYVHGSSTHQPSAKEQYRGRWKQRHINVGNENYSHIKVTARGPCQAGFKCMYTKYIGFIIFSYCF
uniref:Uncharacterized protein n=1 Tax=Nelumbo nucifera TaxID=4432 RepID=A0A822XHK8_NELNU|nr:TPA_asm: hypothetical protein HUJ06_019992 [Nelumbo nucifera]